jgi:hypothetical protein
MFGSTRRWVSRAANLWNRFSFFSSFLLPLSSCPNVFEVWSIVLNKIRLIDLSTNHFISSKNTSSINLQTEVSKVLFPQKYFLRENNVIKKRSSFALAFSKLITYSLFVNVLECQKPRIQVFIFCLFAEVTQHSDEILE